MSEALSRLHDIVAVFADPSAGMLILIGKGESNPPQAPLFIEDLAFALYRSVSKDLRPFGCTLDLPPKGSDEWSISVRYYGAVENTHVGLALFQADMALKEYSLGFRTDGTRIQSSVAAYSTMLRARHEIITAS